MATAADGAFIVVFGNTGSESDVYARRYDAGGQPAEAAFIAHSLPLGRQSQPAVAAGESIGDFVVTLTDAESQRNIFATRFGPDGSLVLDEIFSDGFESNSCFFWTICPE